MTRVIVEKLKDSGYVIDSETMVINISDEQLLRLGRKYFELASNPVTSTYVNVLPDLGADATIPQCSEKKDRYDHEELIHMAQIIKAFCSSIGSCDGCPLANEKGLCRIFGTPNEWMV